MSASQKRNIYSQSEKTLVRELVSIHKNIFENRKTDKVMVQTKNRTWQKIAKDFNVQPGVTKRCAESIKKCWENMKNTAKKEFRNERVELFRTGGGGVIPRPSQTSLDVHAIVANQIDPIPNEFDDDFIEPSLDLIIVPSDQSLDVTHFQTVDISGQRGQTEDILPGGTPGTSISNGNSVEAILNGNTVTSTPNANPGTSTANGNAGTSTTNGNTGRIGNKAPTKRTRADFAETLVSLEQIEHDEKMSFIKMKTEQKKLVTAEKLATYKAKRIYYEENLKQLRCN